MSTPKNHTPNTQWRMAAFAVLFASAGYLQAGDDAIVTDRPDFVESSLTVGSGRTQIETSVNYERDSSEGQKSRTLTTPTLLRFGVTENLELRLESDAYTRTTTDDPATGRFTQSGYSDLDIGMKWHSTDARGATPSIGWLAHAALDSGSAAFRGQNVRPSLRASLEWELADDVGLGIMPGLSREVDAGGERYWAGIFGVVLGYSLSERFRVFGEVAGQQLASDHHGGDIVTVDAGIAWLLTDAIQIDSAVFAGATSNTPDLSWTIGLSVKF